MALLTDYILTDVLAIFVVFLATIILLFKWVYKHWERMGVPYIQPTFPLGNFQPFWKPRLGIPEELLRWYKELKDRGLKYGGTFIMFLPFLQIIDPELVRGVLSTDFNHFMDRGFYTNEKDDPLSAHIVTLSGEKWRKIRTKLTHAFTASKIRGVLPIVVDCTAPMRNVLADNCARSEAIDIKATFTSYTIDVIGSAVFGIECNSFQQEENPFRKYGRTVFDGTALDLLTTMFATAFPKAALKLHIKLMKPEVAKFFIGVVRDTVNYREQNNVTRNDLMQLLIDIRKSDESFSVEQVAAQVFAFFVGGFETTSATGTFCMYELSHNPEIQEKLREEIQEVLKRHDGKITSEALQQMKYMDQVIDETLRKYPPLLVLYRTCTKDYHLPNTDVVIKKGTKIIISSMGLQMDPDYFPNPDKFDPDRFNEENSKHRVPYTYLPFGEGPRACIGLRFGRMQLKVGLTTILKDYRCSLNTRTKYPIYFSTSSLTLEAHGSVWLNMERITY